MAGLILGIDIGTTSLKTAVFDPKGSKQADAVVEYSLITPNTTWVEAPCGVYMDSIRKCLEIVRQKNVDTRQVDPYSLQSTVRENLWIVGELLDVTGLLGGYNLHWAWASGMAAGRALALFAGK